MDTTFIYQIRLQGHLAEQWSDWFSGMTIHNEPNGEATLTGRFTDQAALIGAINQIQALNLTLISVSRQPLDSDQA